MKAKIYIFLLLAALWPLAGCDTAPGAATVTTHLAGDYDLNFIPGNDPAQQFLINVEIGGGSGVAMVMITGPDFAHTATVVANVPIAVGACGANITFGFFPGFNLVAGDNWTMVINNGNIGQPTPGNTVDSVVGLVFSGGTSCAQLRCDGSMLAGAVPSPARSVIGNIGGGGQWYSVGLNQNQATITGAIPEQKVMTLYLGSVLTPVVLPPLVAVGDTITISYRRAIQQSGNNGDFFRVVVTNGSEFLDADYLSGDSMASGDTTHSFTFVAQSPEIMVDFITGLSQQNNYLLLDDLVVSTPAGTIFSEDFEAGPGPDCFVTGGNAARLERRAPEWTIGTLCVSSFNAPSGAYGLSFMDGSLRRLNGSIVNSSSLSSVLSLLGGGGFFDTSGVTGIFAEVWEPTWTHYLSSITVGQQGGSNLVGTFNGESQGHTCLESGELSAARHQTQLVDLESFNWVINITGQVQNCDPPLLPGDSVAFGDTLGTATGDTVAVIQLGSFILGLEPASDDFSNLYNLRGNVGGNLLVMSLSDTLGRATLNGFGVINTGRMTIIGALTGSRVFDSGRICNVTPGSAFTVTLVPK